MEGSSRQGRAGPQAHPGGAGREAQAGRLALGKMWAEREKCPSHRPLPLAHPVGLSPGPPDPSCSVPSQDCHHHQAALRGTPALARPRLPESTSYDTSPRWLKVCATVHSVWRDTPPLPTSQSADGLADPFPLGSPSVVLSAAAPPPGLWSPQSREHGRERPPQPCQTVSWPRSRL